MRRALAPYGCLHRVENILGAGSPDVDYTLLGVSGKVELKHDLATLSLDQVIFAEAWSRPPGRGLWHLVWRHPTGWAIYSATGARLLYSKEVTPQEAALLWTETLSFPTRRTLDLLAPAERRRLS